MTTNERQNLELQYPFEINNESNRDKLMSALEYADCPVSKQDIELIEYQIYLAKIFLQQSQDLHDYLKENKHVNYSFDSAAATATANALLADNTALTNSHRSEVSLFH